mmetsp:Transcript_25312/g.84302  ORF Transcript_25312/g.84302 Transcript_25312/m.84302 type:complete len:253 (-) Transcript_25312:1125-1883(-)
MEVGRLRRQRLRCLGQHRVGAPLQRHAAGGRRAGPQRRHRPGGRLRAGHFDAARRHSGRPDHTRRRGARVPQPLPAAHTAGHARPAHPRELQRSALQRDRARLQQAPPRRGARGGPRAHDPAGEQGRRPSARRQGWPARRGRSAGKRLRRAVRQLRRVRKQGQLPDILPHLSRCGKETRPRRPLRVPSPQATGASPSRRRCESGSVAAQSPQRAVSTPSARQSRGTVSGPLPPPPPPPERPRAAPPPWRGAP